MWGPAQLFIRHGRDFFLNINPVQQRPTNLAQILLDLPRRTAAFA